MNTWVEILNEEKLPGGGGYHICFQNVIYHYANGTTDYGFRFIWRKPGGNLLSSRGQARIPDAVTLKRLLAKAKSAGWFK